MVRLVAFVAIDASLRRFAELLSFRMTFGAGDGLVRAFQQIVCKRVIKLRFRKGGDIEIRAHMLGVTRLAGRPGDVRRFAMKSAAR